MGVYQKYFEEYFNEQGELINIELNYPENFNFGYDVVDEIASENPHKTALVWCNTQNEERVFSFEDVRAESNKIANVLMGAGLKRGDKVMLVLKRHYEYWFTIIALHKLGIVAIPATHMMTVDDFKYRIDASRVNAIVCTNQNDVPSKVRTAVNELGVDCGLWSVQADADGFRNLTDEAKGASTELERQETSASDPMLMYFTSGTTGYPKGVIHDFTYPLAHIFTAKYWHRASEDGLHFTIAETGWAKASYGKLYGQWLVGSAVMVYDFDNFEPKQLINIINKYGVTSFCAPPTVYRYLVRKDIQKMPKLRHASAGGEKLHPEVFRLFKESTGMTICEGYGQTETTILLSNFGNNEIVYGSMGKPSPLFNIELRNKDGSKTPVGEIGEVVVLPKNGKKPVGIFCSYLNNDEQYKHVWRGGVYHTGDAAWMDENGYYWFHGRFDDVIKTGGFRVGPYEIENILMEHPNVLECSVVGIPDELRGQAIKAIVVLTDASLASKATEKEMKDFCNNKLAEYKWIRTIEFVKEMPKTISGKIKKDTLRAR